MQSDQLSMGVTGLAVATFGQRPDLLGAVFGPELQSATPEFMRHDPIGGSYYCNFETRFREFVLVAQDDVGEGVGCACSRSRPGRSPSRPKLTSPTSDGIPVPLIDIERVLG